VEVEEMEKALKEALVQRVRQQQAALRRILVRKVLKVQPPRQIRP